MTIPTFQVALQQEPALYDEWIAALRLSGERDQVLEGAELASQLLAVGRAAVQSKTAHDLPTGCATS